MARRKFVSVKGFDELGENMRLLKTEVSMKICKHANSRAASLVKRAAIALAPQGKEPHMVEGHLVQPGNLKRNIIVKRINTRLTTEYIVTVRRNKKGEQEGAFYAHFEEFGSVNNARRPFLRPAFEQNKEPMVQVIRDTLDKDITKAVNGFPKKAKK